VEYRVARARFAHAASDFASEARLYQEILADDAMRMVPVASADGSTSQQAAAVHGTTVKALGMAAAMVDRQLGHRRLAVANAISAQFAGGRLTAICGSGDSSVTRPTLDPAGRRCCHGRASGREATTPGTARGRGRRARPRQDEPR